MSDVWACWPHLRLHALPWRTLSMLSLTGLHASFWSLSLSMRPSGYPHDISESSHLDRSSWSYNRPRSCVLGEIPNTPNESHRGTESKLPDVRRTTFAPEVVFWAKSPAPNNEPQRYPEQFFSEVFGISEQTLGVPEQFCSLLKKNRACVQNLRFVKICQAGHSTYIFFFSGYLGTWFAWRCRPVRSDSGPPGSSSRGCGSLSVVNHLC